MRTSMQKFMAAMIVATVVAFVTLFSATKAEAQITADNTSNCSVLLTLVGNGGAFSGPHLVPANSTGTVLTVPVGFTPLAVEDVNGRTRFFSTGTGCTPCIPVAADGAQDFCCVTVCYNGGTNSILISGCAGC